jgi:hypothetical protein
MEQIAQHKLTISRDSENYVFDGKGYGHGVGLCQWSSLRCPKKDDLQTDTDWLLPGTKLSDMKLLTMTSTCLKKP